MRIYFEPISCFFEKVEKETQQGHGKRKTTGEKTGLTTVSSVHMADLINESY